MGNLACGGLVRDANGVFIKGFYSRIGFGNAVCLDIKMARQLDIKWAIFELDSKMVVNTVNSETIRMFPCTWNPCHRFESSWEIKEILYEMVARYSYEWQNLAARDCD